ncbi:MAG: DUF3108 domain-containing protein [Fidelibacterota bacterium]
MKKLIAIYFIFSLSLTAACQFEVGERFEYSVKLNFIRAGKAYIELKDITTVRGDSVYHIVSKTRTTGFLDRLFKIREHMESWADYDHLFTRKFYKDVDEVNYEKTFMANFYYSDSVAVLKNGKEVEITTPVMDWLSMIYYLRNQDLFVGQEIEMTFFDNNKFKNYSAFIVGQEEVEVEHRKYLCWVVEPSEKVREDMKHKNELVLYLSVEPPQIPVKITSDAKFGTMILDLNQ